MKMIYCTCNVSSLSDLVGLLDEVGISNYQIINEVTGRSVNGDPRLNTPVWPGYNSSVFLQAEEQDALKIREKIKEYNSGVSNENELVTFCSWALEDYFCD